MEKTKIYTWTDLLYILAVLVLVPFFLFPKLSLTWVFFAFPLIWILRWIRKETVFKRTVLDWALLVLTFQVVISCFIVPDISFSLPKITGFFLGILIFYTLAYYLDSEEYLKIGISVFLGGGFLIALIGVLGMSKHEEPKYIAFLYDLLKKLPSVDFNLPGAEKGFHPNAVAGGLILVFPLCFVLLLAYFKKKNIENMIFKSQLWLLPLCLIFLTIGFVILLTQSRSSFGGLFVGVWFLVFAGWKWKRIGLIVITLVMISILLSFFMMVGSNKIPYTNLEASHKLAGRVSVFWVPAINTISQHPFFGIGMNHVRVIPIIGDEQAHFHNQFLHTAAELGIPALIAYLALLVGVFFICRQVWKKSRKGWMKISALGLGCGQLAFLVFGVMDCIPLGAKIGILFWFSIGLITALYNFVRRSQTG